MIDVVVCVLRKGSDIINFLCNQGFVVKSTLLYDTERYDPTD